MGPMPFFDVGMFIFPFIMIVMIAAVIIFMFIARNVISGRGGFRSRRWGHRGRRGSMMGRGHTFFDEIFADEEETQSTPTSVRQEAESRPTAKSSATEEFRTTSKIQAQLDRARAYQKQINDLIEHVYVHLGEEGKKKLRDSLGRWREMATGETWRTMVAKYEDKLAEATDPKEVERLLSFKRSYEKHLAMKAERELVLRLLDYTIERIEQRDGE